MIALVYYKKFIIKILIFNERTELSRKSGIKNTLKILDNKNIQVDKRRDSMNYVTEADILLNFGTKPEEKNNNLSIPTNLFVDLNHKPGNTYALDTPPESILNSYNNLARKSFGIDNPHQVSFKNVLNFGFFYRGIKITVIEKLLCSLGSFC